jgi:hypothetical protein
MNYSLGVMIICLALIADAIIGNYQEKVMKTHHVSNVEMVTKYKNIFYSFNYNENFRFFIVL